jgi:hypothetical protein
MGQMKKLILALLLVATCCIVGIGAATSASTVSALEVVDEYKLTMILQVPHTFDNMQSLGYRKLKHQRVEGTLKIVYSADGSRSPYIEVTNLVNRSYKLSNGKYVTYTALMGDVFHIGYIGNNRTGVFKKPFVSFSMDCDPSYNVGDDEPDNTLVLECSGYGTSRTMLWNGYKVRYIRSLVGELAGNLGCGCRAYGHTSATRQAGWIGPTDTVVDIAAIKAGRWRIAWKARYIREAQSDDEDY